MRASARSGRWRLRAPARGRTAAIPAPSRRGPSHHPRSERSGFLFTDLKGSTELYERVGDLVAFDRVRAHFRVLQEVVASEAGAVVKTIGDAVMATFPTARPRRCRRAADARGDGPFYSAILTNSGVVPIPRQAALRGITWRTSPGCVGTAHKGLRRSF